MRLAVVTPFLEAYGGVEKVVMKIAEHFDAKVYAMGYRPEATYQEFRKLDVEVVGGGGMLPKGRFFSGINAGRLFYSLKLQDYDVVNAHQSPSEWVRNRNAPMIWYCHSPNREAYDLYEWRMRRRGPVQKAAFWGAVKAFRAVESGIVPKIEHIFTNSTNSQGRIRKYLKRDAEILHPGVEPKEFMCEGYGKFFFYPSRIVPEKEIEYAIEAFRIFSGKRKGWKLVVAGAASERPEHRRYLEGLRGMGVEGVSIRTNVSDAELKGLYAKCLAVLYTPVNEDFGLVPIEAMASSKPCIARNEGGPRETIESGKDGFLVDSAGGMAQRMGELAEKPELAEGMGKAGRRKVLAKFTWKRFMERFGEKAKELAKKA
ncbi:MAG: glycosyltransferase family 4 protein [Candidatus Micrarchaeia archaeon]|jgi:glycosyltransferase involved in cell wall biosynthesis